jgi:hypothetical protein
MRAVFGSDGFVPLPTLVPGIGGAVGRPVAAVSVGVTHTVAITYAVRDDEDEAQPGRGRAAGKQKRGSGRRRRSVASAGQQGAGGEEEKEAAGRVSRDDAAAVDVGEEPVPPGAPCPVTIIPRPAADASASWVSAMLNGRAGLQQQQAAAQVASGEAEPEALAEHGTEQREHSYVALVLPPAEEAEDGAVVSALPTCVIVEVTHPRPPPPPPSPEAMEEEREGEQEEEEGRVEEPAPTATHAHVAAALADAAEPAPAPAPAVATEPAPAPAPAAAEAVDMHDRAARLQAMRSKTASHGDETATTSPAPAPAPTAPAAADWAAGEQVPAVGGGSSSGGGGFLDRLLRSLCCRSA